MPRSNAGSDLKKEQILIELEARYFRLLRPRLVNRSIEEQRKDQFSRCIAALAIQKLSGCSETDAVSAVVDCGDDNGIDAIYYDRRNNNLLVAQTKYGDGPGQAANKVFCDGIRDLLSERYDRFRQSGNNREFDRVQPEVEAALENPSLRVIAIVGYLGNPISPHAVRDLNELQTAQNVLQSRFEWRDIGLPVIYGWLAEEQAIEPITVGLTLERWNFFTEPRRAVYGLACASQLNEIYQLHGKALFQKNIRYYLGNQTVNAAISETVHSHPNELFYLNNGLTIICSRFGYAPHNQNRATFTLERFSIVNGAQTVGAIGQARQIGEISVEAKIMVTILEIGDDINSIDLGQRITRARNTQTNVSREDFAALDSNQERLRRELAISGMIYQYRPTAELANDDETIITIGEAVRALACFYLDSDPIKTKFIVAAKKDVSQLIDRKGPYYRNLFHDGLDGASLYRKVQIYRYVDTILENENGTSQGKRNKFFRHGRYFIMHIWARRNQAMLNKAELILSEDDKLEVSRQILVIAEQIWTVAEPMFAADPKGYLTIFRNLTDAEPLAQAVMRHINEAEEA